MSFKPQERGAAVLRDTPMESDLEDGAWELQAVGSLQVGKGTALSMAVATLELTDFTPSPMGVCSWAMLGLFKFALCQAHPGLPWEWEGR